MVLLVLALIWAVVLVPQHLRNRADNRPGDSVGAFQNQLSVLGRTGLGQERTLTSGPRSSQHTGVRDRRAAARKRRKVVVLGLLAAAVGTLVLGSIPGFGVLLALHLVLDLLLGADVALLVRRRRLDEERKAKVRHLPAASLPSNSTPPPQPAMLLRQSGS